MNCLYCGNAVPLFAHPDCQRERTIKNLRDGIARLNQLAIQLASLGMMTELVECRQMLAQDMQELRTYEVS